MNNTMQIYILFILISFSGGSIFIGLPESNWTMSSDVCSLPAIDKIKTNDIFNKSSEYMDLKEIQKAWTGTVIKYTQWATFIGCGRSQSTLKSGISVKTAEDCLRHCSDYSSVTYFAIKSSTCYCLTNEPEINGDMNDCRAECSNASYTPCSSDRSALVFLIVQDLNIEKSNTYIEKECLTTTRKNKSKFTVSDCNTKHLYGCRNSSSVLKGQTWYEYQELCLKDGSFVLFERNTISDSAKDDPLWTPMFRAHTVVTGTISRNDWCLAVSKAETKYFTVENCSCQFPFLCLGSQKKNTIVDGTLDKTFPSFITLPTSIAVVAILVVIFLIFLIVIISIKSFRQIRNYQEKLKRVNERLPGTEISTYIGIEETNEEVNDSGYKELSDNVTQLRANRHDGIMDKSEDTMDSQGYLVPEQHYHTIPEVEVHYAEANITERNSDQEKEDLDRDDYLVPVT